MRIFQELNEYFTSTLGYSTALSQFLVVFITLLSLLAIPTILSFIFPLFKMKGNKKKNFSLYLYAFSTGFFLILATFGFLRESIEESGEWVQSAFAPNPTQSQIFGYNAMIIVGGLLMGLLFSFTLKFVITYRINKKLKRSNNKSVSVFVHDHDHHSHAHPHIHVDGEDGYSHSNDVDNHVFQHPDYIFSQEENLQAAEEAVINSKVSMKLKVIALLLVLTHRIPEGFLLGYNINLAMQGDSANNLTIAYFISLILHLIPEETIFYFRLREAGFNRWKSLLLSFLGLSLFLPFMLAGVYAGEAIDHYAWLKAVTFAAIAGIFLFTSIVEFIPEFYHTDMSKKKWYLVLLALFIGIIIAVLILSFHSHHH
ncbi:ZIP family metal transporter [Mycoplasma sp. Pen4]|uniref:ZIP family metal transporter n=1 Tax=Mycoplasma sp. Pen4 TaxID=640330 RepID=UPI001654C0C4|nr:ZIP family metal transporter [Mycoplasma sp. Pen4]QNM93553.1 ZIP family metal transporter [Mycoplasma sp. Pen4]